ncbi:hypothetical protein SteCoe_13073 [Stentor coeruleus]|uniref:Uncharacterized protein n=1 Tax=Stentor coeruleus TaxID=5963 RepID=A0A1R2C9B5_9CILI|nr:hypothetical protein SteCoe_13073 [Stentor coeruleus]
MEELLQSVSSVRKTIQERRNSRARVESFQSVDFRLQIPSPRSGLLQKSFSKPNIPKIQLEKPMLNRLAKMSEDEFSRFMQSPLRSLPENKIKLSPSRKRTYKLDAASLLVSRIKEFLKKKLRIWKEITEKAKRNDGEVYKKELVFKVNLGKRAEKVRYVSRERISDDEIQTAKNTVELPIKAHTSRMSPKSPVLIDFNKNKIRGGSRGYEQRPPIIEVLAEDSGLIKSKICKIIPEKNNLISARPASTYLRGSIEKAKPKGQGRKNPTKMFLVLSKLIHKITRSMHFHLKSYSKLSKFHSLLQHKLSYLFKLTTSSIFISCTYSNIQEAVSKIHEVFNNKIAEIFYFMKFRCVVESGLFEDSSIDDSSKDDLGQSCNNTVLETLKKQIKSCDSQRRPSQKSITYLVIAPSFFNLLMSVEQKVRFRHFHDFCNLIIKTYTQMLKGLKILAKFNRNLMIFSLRSIKKQSKTKRLYVKTIKNMCENLEKDAKFRVSSAWRHWKLFGYEDFDNHKQILQGGSLFLAFKRIFHQRTKELFLIYSRTKYRKFANKPKTQYNIIKGVQRLEKSIKRLQRKTLQIWSLIPSKPKSLKNYNLKALINIHTKSFRIQFNQWRQKSLILSFYKQTTIKTFQNTIKTYLKAKFRIWQKNFL